jgi:hypothetical protein
MRSEAHWRRQDMQVLFAFCGGSNPSAESRIHKVYVHCQNLAWKKTLITPFNKQDMVNEPIVINRTLKRTFGENIFEKPEKGISEVLEIIEEYERRKGFFEKYCLSMKLVNSLIRKYGEL